MSHNMMWKKAKTEIINHGPAKVAIVGESLITTVAPEIFEQLNIAQCFNAWQISLCWFALGFISALILYFCCQYAASSCERKNPYGTTPFPLRLRKSATAEKITASSMLAGGLMSVATPAIFEASGVVLPRWSRFIISFCVGSGIGLTNYTLERMERAERAGSLDKLYDFSSCNENEKATGHSSSAAPSLRGY